MQAYISIKPGHPEVKRFAEIDTTIGMFVMEDAVTQWILEKFPVLEQMLGEQAEKLWAAVSARSLGRGGIVWVSEAMGMSEPERRRKIWGWRRR